MPPLFWVAALVASLSVIYLILEIVFVRPYLWPGGHGALMVGDPHFAGGSSDRTVILARPPEMTAGSAVIRDIVPESPAAQAGLQAGDVILQRSINADERLDLSALMNAPDDQQLRIWRAAYHAGLRGPVTLRIRRTEGGTTREWDATLDRRTGWRSPMPIFRAWMRVHLGMMAQVIFFTAAAVVLLLLRGNDTTAALASLALALCAVAGGGPLQGSERALPGPLAAAMTVFSWTASPWAFPIISLAILHFPSKSRLLKQRPWLTLVPFLVALPMIVPALLTALFLAGMDAALPLAVWDSTHPSIFYGSFAAALTLNVLTMAEGIARFRSNQDVNERRRIKLVTVMTVFAVAAYVIKDGISAVTLLAVGMPVIMPWWVEGLLQLLVLLPAFGVTYAVLVHRVLGTRWVLRRSLQYALANKTLTGLAVLPGVALAWSLYSQRDRTLAEIVSGAPALFVALLGLSIAGLRYRERARAWLDHRFFRQEYNAQKILTSLAGRIRFESDPTSLAEMVVNEIDQALHPSVSSVLVAGLDEGWLTPVSVLRGSVESLPLDGGLVAMLRWSNEPLDIYLQDPRSPARRLPAAEQEWLECTGAALLMPIVGQDTSLIGVLVLGEKLSEEPYDADDKALLSSIAAQVGLYFDVAQFRSRASAVAPSIQTGHLSPTGASGPLLVECPRCGRCEEVGITMCPSDGTAMVSGSTVPRTVELKYRIDQLLGRGGMGAVYRARDMRLDRDVAIKVVRPDLLGDPDARRRFRREAQIVAKLQHPSIVAIYDYGTLWDGGAYLVMEFVRGDDLRRVLRREGRLELDRALRILDPVCVAIEAAHVEGILHRDLKPENILLPGGHQQVKVLDFGVAKLISDDTSADSNLTTAASLMTQQGSILGTPAYMAPEQLRGQHLDARSDVFSLGVIAYEMLTGMLPFGSTSLADIALRQLHPPTAFASLGIDVPKSLEEVLLAALAPQPTTRPGSPAAFASQLKSVVA